MARSQVGDKVQFLASGEYGVGTVAYVYPWESPCQILIEPLRNSVAHRFAITEDRKLVCGVFAIDRPCSRCTEPYWDATRGYATLQLCPACLRSHQKTLAAAAQRRRRAAKRTLPTTCLHCGEPMTATRKTRKFCSDRCRVAANRKDGTKACSSDLVLVSYRFEEIPTVDLRRYIRGRV